MLLSCVIVLLFVISVMGALRSIDVWRLAEAYLNRGATLRKKNLFVRRHHRRLIIKLRSRIAKQDRQNTYTLFL